MRRLAWSLLLALALVGTASAQDVGFTMSVACTDFAAPSVNGIVCWEQGTQTLKFWNGSAWVPLTGSTAAVTSITGTPPITASVPVGAVTLSLAPTAVTPGTYGDATHVGAFTVDAQGRLTGASSTAITAGVTALAGTANQITASAATGAVTVSLPSTVIAPGSVQGDLRDRGGAVYDVRAYGVATTNTPSANVTALNTLASTVPAGVTIAIPEMYPVNGTITFPKAVKIQCAGPGTGFQVDAATGATTDIIKIEPTGASVQEFYTIRDCTIQPASGTPGRYGIYLSGASADIENLLIDRVWVKPLGSYSIFADGAGAGQGTPAVATIRGSWLQGGIKMTNAGDTVRIIDNLISGLDISQIAGASVLLVQGNSINVAVHIGTAIAPHFVNNEIEVASGGSNGAMLDLDGPVTNALIEGGTFQPSGGSLNGIRINNATATKVVGATFFRGVGAKDVAITASAIDTHIGLNSWSDGLPWTSMVSDAGSTRPVVHTPLAGTLYTLNPSTGTSAFQIGLGASTNDLATLTTAGNSTTATGTLSKWMTTNSRSGSAVTAGVAEWAHEGAGNDDKTYLSLQFHNGTSLVERHRFFSTGGVSFDQVSDPGAGIVNALTGYAINLTSVLTATTLGSGVLNSSLTSVGTLGTGTWQASVIAGQYGGTGVANTGKTVTLGGNLTTSGAFALTLTLSGTTGVTLPTTGTLATLAGSEALTNKTLTAVSVTTPLVTFNTPDGLIAQNTSDGTDNSRAILAGGGAAAGARGAVIQAMGNEFATFGGHAFVQLGAVAGSKLLVQDGNGNTQVQVDVNGLTLPKIPSLTGTRYLCIDTTGKVTSSASACSGT